MNRLRGIKMIPGQIGPVYLIQKSRAHNIDKLLMPVLARPLPQNRWAFNRDKRCSCVRVCDRTGDIPAPASSKLSMLVPYTSISRE